MKIFSFVFIIYVIFLSLAPCDELAVKAESVFDDNFSSSAAQAMTRTAEPDKDDCSPFCICSCCHFSAVQPIAFFSITDEITVAADFTVDDYYRNPYAQNYKTSIWQPPKSDSKA